MGSETQNERRKQSRPVRVDRRRSDHDIADHILGAGYRPILDGIRERREDPSHPGSSEDTRNVPHPKSDKGR